MSITIMTQAWLADIPSGRKLVLLSLADNANDRGECYPSVDAVAARCGLSVRAVQGHIADLEKTGMVSRENRHGRSNLFTLHHRRFCTPQNLHPAESAPTTPAESAPPQNLHPAESAPHPAESAPHPAESAPPTPAESAPITVIEPSLNRQSNHHGAKRAQVVGGVFGLGDVDQQVLADWLAHRKRRKADVTATVVADLRKQAALAGLSVEDAIRTAIRRGWTGFEAAWVGSSDRPAADVAPARQGRHSGFAGKDYRKGVADDGSFS
jgi:pyruvate/2-oxoglutarate dehydrogenase complex dihydrolipoamide acyltransferase (E2) component